MNAVQVGQYDVAEVTLGAVPGDLSSDEELNLIVVDPGGQERRVPAFVTNGEWRARYSSGALGAHHFRSEPDDRGPSTIEGVIEVDAASGAGGLRSHGPVRVAGDRRHLEHADGTPFFWLADTWWHGFTTRISDDEFRDFAAKRAGQGFSVVQIVAGLYPEMGPFAPEGRSKSGWVWHDGFTAPNLSWFDEADARVVALVDHDLVPCIVGSWAYYLQFMDVEQMLRHWREMIARWSAYPVVWCLVGGPGGVWPEDLEDYVATVNTLFEEHSADTFEELIGQLLAADEPLVSEQLDRLAAVARGVRRLDPFERSITIHSVPSKGPWEFLEDESVVDFWLLHTGHVGANILSVTMDSLHEALAHTPTKPVINGEVCYEGHSGSSWQEIQRFLFWSHALSGTAGHTYGAKGVWAFNTPEVPGLFSGLAPTWKEASEFPGGMQVGLGRQILTELPWHRFEARPEWVSPHQHQKDRFLPYAAGVDEGTRIFYFPSWAITKNPFALWSVHLCELGGYEWQARLINPRTGDAGPPFAVAAESNGMYRLRAGYLGVTALPSSEDWVLILRHGGEPDSIDAA